MNSLEKPKRFVFKLKAVLKIQSSSKSTKMSLKRTPLHKKNKFKSCDNSQFKTNLLVIMVSMNFLKTIVHHLFILLLLEYNSLVTVLKWKIPIWI